MKIRTDLTAAVVTLGLVAAVVVLTVTGHEVPELLTLIASVTLGIYGGAVAPTHLASTPAAAQTEDPPVQVPSSSALALKMSGPEPTPAPAAAPAPAPRTELVPGRDWTETIPKITPEMLAADKAARA